MTLPGPVITAGTQRASRTFPTDTSTFFLTGESEQGKAGTAIELRSAGDIARKLGARLSANPLAFDSLEYFFSDGGGRAYFSREVGPSALRASSTCNDGSAVATMKIWAKGEGAYGNKLNRQILAGTVGFIIKITHDDDGTLEQSPDLATVTEAVAWGENTSGYVTVEDLGASSSNPATGSETSLSGGTDDRGNISQTEIDAAWAALPASLGPGQCASPGRTTDAAHAAVIAHGLANNRVPRLDPVDTATVATVTAKADTDRGVSGHITARYAWPWIEITGVTQGTTRLVPPSAALAALEARNDMAGVSPNQPAAGITFGALRSRLLVGLSQDALTDANRETMADKGVTVFRTLDDGSIVAYDTVTLANQTTDPDNARAGLGRLLMRLRAEAKPVTEQYVGREITADNLLELEGKVETVVQKYSPGSIPGYTVAAADLSECREAEEFRVDAYIQVTPDGRVVRLTFTAEGAR